jgi:hypothetical protein|tara:strand:- start:465 stop:1073 length:609 start_codon:yes stop_codon:yes gene_type:complete
MLEKLLSKRNQILQFEEDVFPDKELVKSLIQKTHELVSSKQNLMPYEVIVLGPDKIEEKKELFELSQNTQSAESNFTNSYHNRQLLAPYVLIFTQRLAFPPNLYVQKLIKKGREYKECNPLEYKKCRNIPAIEVGMFMLILTGLCLENNIDVSYTACLPWNQERFTFINEDLYISMSLGYKRYKRARNGEHKPHVDEIITWL